MINLSMSSIKDFLKCSKMFYYRKAFPEEATSTEHANIGTVVHKLIEMHWKQEDYDSTFTKLVTEYGIERKGCDKIEMCMYSYYNCFREFTDKFTDDDMIEYAFSVPISKDVTLNGKMDRVLINQDIIIDWKTGTTKRDISNDIQFIIYYTVYEKIFGRAPMVYQINLSNDEAHLYQPREVYIDTLYKSIIPKIVDSINEKNYYKEGYFNGSCYRCSYIPVCSKDP